MKYLRIQTTFASVRVRIERTFLLKDLKIVSDTSSKFIKFTLNLDGSLKLFCYDMKKDRVFY
jgi:hypothetical protein